MALPFYNQGDQDIYAGGEHYIPQEQYRLNYTPSTTLASTVGNTGGVTGTQAALPYIWPPRGGGGGGGASAGSSLSDIYGYDPNAGIMVDRDVWSGTDWVNTPKEAFMTSHGLVDKHGRNLDHLGLGDKIPSLLGSIFDKNWGQRKVGDVKGTFTEGWDKGLGNIKEGWEDEKEKFKNIGVFKKWRENKAVKKAEKVAASKAGKDAADAAAQGEATNIGGGWTQTNTGGGGATFSGPDGQTHQGWSNTPEGYGAAAASEGSFKKGGRIGYNRGRVVNPGGYQGDEFEDENVLEFMQDQGIPHSGMVEGPSPFELRIEELMDEGMSWQEAYEIASQEFATAEGPEESFSEDGIASIV
jgi:hypothetical protein